MERRTEPRQRALFDLSFSSECLEGEGVLADLSLSGAAIESATVRPRLGSRVRIEIFVEPNRPLQFLGIVRRHTKTGFATEHQELGPEQDEFIAEVTALVEGREKFEIET